MLYIVKSRAKVNLFLNILGKDSRGYHNLQSYCVFLNLSDSVYVSKSEKVTSCSFKNVTEQVENNTIIKAVRYINKINHSNQSVKVQVRKNIPIAAGLGGGSSNAAAMLHLLPKIWGLPKLTRDQRKDLAYKIGADVPFFYNNQNALIEDIGDKITPININQKFFILLINPGLQLITKDIYSYVKNNFSQHIILDKKSIVNEIISGKNSLEEYVVKQYPLIKELLEIMRKQNNCVASKMSGSGSTCFALFRHKKDIIEARNNLRRIFKSFWFYYERIYI